MAYLCSSSQRIGAFKSVGSLPLQLPLGNDKIYYGISFNIKNPLDMVGLVTRLKSELTEYFGFYKEDPSIVNAKAFSYKLLQLIEPVSLNFDSVTLYCVLLEAFC